MPEARFVARMLILAWGYMGGCLGYSALQLVQSVPKHDMGVAEYLSAGEYRVQSTEKLVARTVRTERGVGNLEESFCFPW